MPTGINQFQLIERVLIQTDDARHGTHALREHVELPLQNFMKKFARDPSFLNRPVRYDVLHPRGDIRRSSSARRDASFLNRPVRYGVLHPRGRYFVLRPRGEMRRSWTARWDTTFIVRAARSVVLQPPGKIRRSSAGRRDTTFCRSAIDLFSHVRTNTKTNHFTLEELHATCRNKNKKNFVYRRAVRRKANLEVTGEEKPKTSLRRRKANKRLCREKKPVWALPDEEKPVSLVSDEKKASLRRPRTKNYNKRHFAHKNTNKKHLRDYTWYQLHLNFVTLTFDRYN